MARTDIRFVPVAGVKINAGAETLAFVATGRPLTSNWKDETLTREALVKRRAEKLTAALVDPCRNCGALTKTAGLVVG